jgi:hypothetical protein
MPSLSLFEGQVCEAIIVLGKSKFRFSTISVYMPAVRYAVDILEE